MSTSLNTGAHYEWVVNVQSTAHYLTGQPAPCQMQVTFDLLQGQDQLIAQQRKSYNFPPSGTHAFSFGIDIPPNPGEGELFARLLDMNDNMLAYASLPVTLVTPSPGTGTLLFHPVLPPSSIITINGQTYYPENVYTMNVGVYQYSAACPGYNTKTGTVTIVKDQLTEVSLTLDFIYIDGTYVFHAAGIPGVQITMGTEQKYLETEYHIDPGTYFYVATAPGGYDIVESNFTVVLGQRTDINIPFSNAPGSVHLYQKQPSNASVTVNNQPIEVGQSVYLPPGTYEWRASAPNYTTNTGTIRVRAGAESTLNIFLAQLGSFTVDAVGHIVRQGLPEYDVPLNASIYLNNYLIAYTNKTTYTQLLEPGTWSFKVTCEGYTDYVSTLIISNGQNTPVHAVLQQQPPLRWEVNLNIPPDINMGYANIPPYSQIGNTMAVNLRNINSPTWNQSPLIYVNIYASLAKPYDGPNDFQYWTGQGDELATYHIDTGVTEIKIGESGVWLSPPGSEQIVGFYWDIYKMNAVMGYAPFGFPYIVRGKVVAFVDPTIPRQYIYDFEVKQWYYYDPDQPKVYISGNPPYYPANWESEIIISA